MYFSAELFIAFSCVVIVSYLLTRGYGFLAQRFGLLAEPNARSAHNIPTPTGSGVVFVVMFYMLVSYCYYGSNFSSDETLLLIGPLLVAVLGFIDDLYLLKVRTRLPVYFGAACWSVFFVEFSELDILGYRVAIGSLGLIIGILFLVWFQNLYNFMDGMDGLAGMECVFVCASVLFLAPTDSLRFIDRGALPIVILLALITGFLVVNWPDAKVFMGDVGSGFIGLLLGINVLSEVLVSLWVWIILLGYFIADATVTIAVRLVGGEKVYISHTSHAYQHLARKYGKVRTLHSLSLLNVMFLFPLAWLATRYPDYGAVLMLCALCPLSLGIFYLGAGQASPIKLLRIKSELLKK